MCCEDQLFSNLLENLEKRSSRIYGAGLVLRSRFQGIHSHILNDAEPVSKLGSTEFPLTASTIAGHVEILSRDTAPEKLRTWELCGGVAQLDPQPR